MKFFRCYATPRSGHMSIMCWLSHQHSAVTQTMPIKFGCKRKGLGAKRAILPTFLNAPNYQVVVFPNVSKRDKPNITQYLDVDRLILGYENGATPRTIPYNFDIPYINILILRDIFNTAASIKKFRIWQKRYPQPHEYPKHIMENWLLSAKAVQNKEGYFINYNLYNHNKDYRQQLARDLGLFFTDIGIDEVLSPGSSFTAMNKPDRANLNRRYKMVDIGPLEELYPEHVELSNQIFGEME